MLFERSVMQMFCNSVLFDLPKHSARDRDYIRKKRQKTSISLMFLCVQSCTIKIRPSLKVWKVHNFKVIKGEKMK